MLDCLPASVRGEHAVQGLQHARDLTSTPLLVSASATVTQSLEELQFIDTAAPRMVRRWCALGGHGPGLGRTGGAVARGSASRKADSEPLRDLHKNRLAAVCRPSVARCRPVERGVARQPDPVQVARRKSPGPPRLSDVGIRGWILKWANECILTVFMTTSVTAGDGEQGRATVLADMTSVKVFEPGKAERQSSSRRRCSSLSEPKRPRHTDRTPSSRRVSRRREGLHHHRGTCSRRDVIGVRSRRAMHDQIPARPSRS